MKLPNLTRLSALALIGLAAAVPAFAHHGKDFMLLETDDRPLPGSVYFVGSYDTVIDTDGQKSEEYTAGVLFGIGDRLAVEPHVHYARSPQTGLHYDAAALGIRYAAGYLGRSEWRFALSGEVEKPNDGAEPTNGLARLILVRNLPDTLVAANILVGRTFDSAGAQTYGLQIGALKPLAPKASATIEVSTAFPLRDGVEILPGYVYKLDSITTAKAGIGYYTSNATKSGTLHVQLIRRF